MNLVGARLIASLRACMLYTGVYGLPPTHFQRLYFPMVKTQRDPRLVSLLGFVTMVLIWGSFPVVAKIGVAYAPPLLLSGMRFCIAFCVMAAIAIAQRKRLAMTRKQHVQVFMISLLMVSIPSSI